MWDITPKTYCLQGEHFSNFARAWSASLATKSNIFRLATSFFTPKFLFQLRRYIKHSRQCFIGYPSIPRILSKMHRCKSYFQLSSQCLDILMKHSLSCLISVLHRFCSISDPGKLKGCSAMAFSSTAVLLTWHSPSKDNGLQNKRNFSVREYVACNLSLWLRVWFFSPVPRSRDDWERTRKLSHYGSLWCFWLVYIYARKLFSIWKFLGGTSDDLKLVAWKIDPLKLIYCPYVVTGKKTHIILNYYDHSNNCCILGSLYRNGDETTVSFSSLNGLQLLFFRRFTTGRYIPRITSPCYMLEKCRTS